MKILITGGAGFIGSNLVLSLQKNNEVTVIDNLFTGNIKNLDNYEGEILNIDISKPFELKEGFDVIIHEASITDTTFKPDEEMIKQNVNGFKNILNFALKNNSTLVYASSAAVYGNGKVPMEEDQRLNPLNAYAKSKAMIDEIAKKYMEKIRIVGLRYFNVFGPREQYKGKSASMILQLRKQIMSGKNPKLFKFGEQKRDHIYVKDVVRATIKAIKAESGIYNVGTGIATSFNELVNVLNEILKTENEIEYFDNPIERYYQNNTQASTKLAESMLKWKAEYSLKKGIKEYMKWLEENEGEINRDTR